MQFENYATPVSRRLVLAISLPSMGQLQKKISLICVQPSFSMRGMLCTKESVYSPIYMRSLPTRGKIGCLYLLEVLVWVEWCSHANWHSDWTEGAYDSPCHQTGQAYSMCGKMNDLSRLTKMEVSVKHPNESYSFLTWTLDQKWWYLERSVGKFTHIRLVEREEFVKWLDRAFTEIKKKLPNSLYIHYPDLSTICDNRKLNTVANSR